MPRPARPTRKKPSDYPQMAFRVSAADKTRLEQLIDEVHKLANKRLEPDHLKFKKNELIVDALWNGLLNIKRNHRRL
jgi:hypothetical protein